MTDKVLATASLTIILYEDRMKVDYERKSNAPEGIPEQAYDAAMALKGLAVLLNRGNGMSIAILAAIGEQHELEEKLEAEGVRAQA